MQGLKHLEVDFIAHSWSAVGPLCRRDENFLLKPLTAVKQAKIFIVRVSWPLDVPDPDEQDEDGGIDRANMPFELVSTYRKIRPT